ncbi:SDR family NAD(P)-dependent oxidoreductase [Mesorhizobium sp. M0488]|uniref:SDR family NAD(P)-dependent oxidoreductase n=1 Tax=unclassified Mesorhizobium TaxID=325217 RepID=UPI00333AF0B7
MTASSAPLAGKVALVTGASSGIGEAAAAALAAAGAKVAVAARRAGRLEALAVRIEKAGGTALRIEADVTSNGDVTAMVEKVVSEWGRLDILVNNAGVMLLSPAAEATLDDWRRMVELNLLALMGVTKAALPHLKAAKGHIVNVSSIAGRVANPGASGYAATKFGVVGFSESLRREVYADKVRVTVIEPGLVRTELGDHITNAASKAGLDQRLATMEALTAEDVAAAILYAVSQPARVNVNEIVIRPTDQER